MFNSGHKQPQFQNFARHGRQSTQWVSTAFGHGITFILCPVTQKQLTSSATRCSLQWRPIPAMRKSVHLFRASPIAIRNCLPTWHARLITSAMAGLCWVLVRVGSSVTTPSTAITLEQLLNDSSCSRLDCQSSSHVWQNSTRSQSMALSQS